MAKSSKRPIAVFKAPRRIGTFIFKCRGIVQDIITNLSAITTVPTTAQTTTDLDALAAAQTIAQTKVPGSAAARNVAYDVVLDDMHGLQQSIQYNADIAVDEAAAIALIQASGFGLKNHGVRVKAPLEAKQTAVAGEIKLIAKAAGRRASYDWQLSLDGGAWTNLPSTLTAKTLVTDLTSGTKYYFRVRSILKAGTSAWSVVVSITVQ